MRDTFIYGIRLAMAALLTATSLASCIDEDLSECGHDYRIGYSVRLRTNITTEISAELTTPTEQAFGGRLEGALKDVFTDHARDVYLAFYTDDGNLSQHEQHQMDASEASYTLYLPVKDYRHVALANADAEPQVAIDGKANLKSLALLQQEADTIDSHSVGLFSARRPMHVEDRDQDFDVTLYMQNCASCLVLSPGDTRPDEVWGYADGFANGFEADDSTYVFDRNTVVRERLLRDESSGLYGLYAATFPSRDTATDVSPSPMRRTSVTLWRMYVYVRMNGKITQTTLSVTEPLRAGQLRIIKGVIKPDGGVATNTQSVGVSVKLDWKPGGQHDIEV